MPAGDGSAFQSGIPLGLLEGGSTHNYFHQALRPFSLNHHLYLIRVSFGRGERLGCTLDMSAVITAYTHTHSIQAY